MKKLMEAHLQSLLMLQALYTSAVFRLPRDLVNEASLKAQIQAEKAKFIDSWAPKDQA